MRHTRRIRRRRGFGLIEIVILVGVLALVGLLGAQAMIEADRLKRVRETALKLDAMRVRIYSTAANGAFAQVVGVSPGRLSHLQTAIVNGDEDACGLSGISPYSNQERNRWPNAAPYTNFDVSAPTGLATPIGNSEDQIYRNPVGPGGANGELMIRFNDVDLEDIILLDEIVDGTTANSTQGFIRWTTASGVTTFNYTITQTNNNC